MFQIPVVPHDVIEIAIAKDCYGLFKNEAVKLIKSYELVPYIAQEDKTVFKNPTGHCYISHRINLIIKKGKVTGVSIG